MGTGKVVIVSGHTYIHCVSVPVVVLLRVRRGNARSHERLRTFQERNGPTQGVAFLRPSRDILVLIVYLHEMHGNPILSCVCFNHVF